jgi:hypothetical protein
MHAPHIGVKTDDGVVIEARLLQIFHDAANCAVNVIDHRVVDLSLWVRRIDVLRKRFEVRIGNLQGPMYNICAVCVAVR